jgi:hypothetical protein
MVLGSSKGMRSYIRPPGQWHGVHRVERIGRTVVSKRTSFATAAGEGDGGAVGSGVGLAGSAATDVAGAAVDGRASRLRQPETMVAARATTAADDRSKRRLMARWNPDTNRAAASSGILRRRLCYDRTMKLSFAAALLALAPAVGLAASPPAPRAVLPFIEDDYPRALQQARAKHVPIFLEAWAPW